MVSRQFVVGAAALMCSAALFASGAMAQYEQLPTVGLSLESARAGLQAAMDKAHASFPSTAFSICILDPAGRLKAFVRLDDVPFTIHSVACNKAKGSLQIATNTETVQSYPDLPGQFLFRFQNFNGFFTTIPGGVLIRDAVSGNVTGAIGASGSFNPADDVAVATAGAAAIASGQKRPITTPLSPPATTTRKRDSLPLTEAVQRLEAAMVAAYNAKTSSQAITVVDHMGNVVANHVMDGTLVIAYDLTIAKGVSAVKFNVKTSHALYNALTNVTNRWYTFDAANAPDSYYTSLDGGLLFNSSDAKPLGAISASGAGSDAADRVFAAEGQKIASAVTRKPLITLSGALTAIQSALNNAGGYRAAAVVLDVGGNLVAYAAHDGVAAGVFDICKRKALAAVFAPVEFVLPAVRPGQLAYSLQWTNKGMVVYAGGSQLVDADGTVKGFIAVWTDAFDTAQATEKAAVDAAARDYASNTTTPVTLATFSPSNAFTQPAPRAYVGELITLAQAVAAANGAVVHSPSAASVAVRDGRGELRLFVRSDDAVLGSVELALQTSRTSYLFPYPSHRLQPYLNPNTGSLYTADIANGGLVAIPGGLPLTNSADQLVGSVGVNFGLPDDETVHDVLKASEAFFLSAGGSGVGLAIGADCGKDYKSSFTAALALVILFGLALLGCGLWYFIRGGKRDAAPSGYREQP